MKKTVQKKGTTLHRPLIGIYVSQIDPSCGPRFTDPYYQAAYTDLCVAVHQQGGRAVLLHSQASTYQGDSIFSEYWSLTKNHSNFTNNKKAISVDLIYNKARFEGDIGTRIISNSHLEKICSNKYLGYQAFPSLHPKTWYTTSKEALMNVLANKEGKYVIKGLDSNGGKQVWVDTAEKLSRRVIDFPEKVLCQEFIETSGGIEGIVDGRHDLRVAVFNGQIIHARLRTPPSGGEVSNISFGGHNAVIDPTLLPGKLIDITLKVIDRVLKKYGHRFYSVDFGNTADGWKVFELNAWPGITPKSEGPDAERYVNRLAACLVSTARTCNKEIAYVA